MLGKPLLAEKFRVFRKKVLDNGWKIGTNLRTLELVYSNRCNFKCKHCSTRAPMGAPSSHEMILEDISSLADQAHSLGIYEFNLHGGELLLEGDSLFDIIKAIKPERFYLFLTSNGYLLNEKTAQRLSEAGIDRVSISLDSFNEKVHDDFRGKSGAYKKAMQALDHVKKAGMAPFMNVTVGQYNVFSEDLESLLRYSKDHGYTTFINIAMPTGNWQGKLDVMIDESGRQRLLYLRKKYGNLARDLWDPFDKNKERVLGCQTISKLFITPNGDVLVCSFLHIKIGNIYEQSLKDIVNYGYSIKYFKEHSELCLAGEDREFVRKYLMDEMSMSEPLDAKDVFSDNDYV